MKKTTLLKTIILLLTLTMGSTSVWADEVTFAYGDYKGKGTSSSGSSYTMEKTDVSIGDTKFYGNNSQAHFYASGVTTITPASGVTITSIELTATSENYNGYQSSGTVTPSTGSMSHEETTVTWTGSATSEFTINHNKQIRWTSIVVTYTKSGGSSVAKPAFSETGAVAYGTEITLTQNEADEIRYTTDGTEPTKSTGTVYNSPITITEAVIIKAIAIKGEEVSDVATSNYTISVAVPSFSPGTGSYLQGSSLTITSAGNTIYYTSDGSTPNNESTNYTMPIVISSGKTTYKAIAYDSYGNASNVTTCTITGITPVSLPFSWSKGTTRATINSMTGVSQTGLDSDYADANYKLKFNGDNDNIIIFTDEKPAKVSIGVKMNGSNASKFSIQESANGAVFTEVEQLTISGSEGDVVNLETTKAFAATTRVIKLNFIKGSNVGVGPVSITAEPATISLNVACTDGEKIYGTYSNAKAFVVPDGLTVSAVGISDGKLVVTNYETGDIVKANTGVMVSATSAGDKTVALSSETGTEISGNCLKPTGSGLADAAAMSAIASGCKYYRLTMHNGTDIGFWWGAEDGAAFAYDTANRAFLAVPNSVDARGLWFDEGETTAINEVRSLKPDVRGEYFNLNGQRIAQPTKGLYIVNGKKVVIK